MAINLNDYNLIEKGLYQHSGDPTKWVARYTASDGKRKRKLFTVAKDSKANMKLYAMNKLSELIGTAPIAAITVEELFIKWLTPKEKELSLGTVYLHKGTFKNHIEPFIGSVPVAALTPLQITKLLSRDVSARTKKKVMEILKPLYDYAIDNEIVTISPLKPSHKVKRNSLKEKKKVVDAVAKYKRVHKSIMELDNPTHKALMLFGIHGRRKTETLLIQWDDILEDTYIVRAENNKVNEDMVYHLPNDLKPVLKQLKKERVSKYVFDSPKKSGQPMTDIRDIVYKVRDNSKVPELTFHWLRNLSVTALSQMGTPLVDLSAMLGHTDINTLQKYLSIERTSASARTNAASERLLND